MTPWTVATAQTAQTAQMPPATPPPADAAGTPKAGTAPLGDEQDTIIVTGTRQSGRTVAESLSPIQSLNADTLEHSGKVGLQEILADVLPSFTLPSQAGGNLSNVIRVAQLRGLNPDQTLILVNGKRRHPGSIVNISGTVGIGAQPTDLNLIPPGLISRVEVLSDGASAQYGSDAIAGVINIILKKNDSGGSLVAQGGQYYKGDGKNGTADLEQGFKLGDRGFIDLSASILYQANTDRAQDATITPLYYPGDPRNSLPDGKRQFGYGLPRQLIAQVGFNMEEALTDSLSFYSFGTYSYQRARQWLGYRAPSNVNNVLAIYPEGFQPKNEVRQNDFGITSGLRDNDVAGFAADLSVTAGQNRNDVILYDSVSPTYGTASQTQFYLGRLISSQLTTNLDLKREFEIGLAAPVSLALGAEYKLDGYRIEAGDVQSYASGPFPVLTGPSMGLFTDIPGSQAASGFTPADASSHYRHSFSGYVDLATELLKDWQIDAAGRVEHYSDFGGNVSGKLSTRYAIFKNLAFRGTVSNGFRAPSLGQQYYSTSSTSQYKGVDYKIALLPVSSQAAQLLGAKPLKAEKSFNLSGGFVFTPSRHFTFSVDAYRIAITDRIVLSANIGLLSTGALNPTVAALLLAQGIQGVNVGRYFLNGVNTRTEGVDVVGTYNTQVGPGTLNLTLAFNAGDTKITSLSAAASAPIYGTTVFDRVAQAQITGTTPANKLILSANYDIGKFSFFARGNRYGHYVAPSTVLNGDSYAPPSWTADVETRFRFTDRIQLGIGAQNVFNKYPALANPANFAAATYNGANYYNALSPYGISGGDYYARVILSW